MSREKLLRALFLTAAALACVVPAAAPAATGSGSEARLLAALLRSRELWATIDVCSPSDQPDYVGVRGSMPGDRHPHDAMYMRFRLQYREPNGERWVDLASASSPYAYVGAGGSVRQDGQSFKLVPKPDMAPSTLRGVVDYQWRRGKRIVQSASRSTTAGHTSVSGADPAGYSSASCVIG